MGHRTHGFARLVQGLTIGAAAMYLMDPDKGRRRRAIARDKLQRFANDSLKLAQQATRDVQQRLHGVNARLGQRLAPQGDVDELRLIERVRSSLGRCVAHPHAIQVGARGSTVVLSGPVLRHEVGDLLSAARAVAGVGAVENHLDAHDRDDGIPSLQGEGRRRGHGGPEAWTPALRMGALIGGGVLALYGLGKRSTLGLLLGGAGMSLATRVVRNDAGERSAGSSAGPQAGLSGSAARAGAGAATARVGDDGAPRGQGRQDAASGRSQRDAPDSTTAMPQEAPLLGDDGTPATAQRNSGPRGRMSQSRDASHSSEAPTVRGDGADDSRMDRPPF